MAAAGVGGINDLNAMQKGCLLFLFQYCPNSDDKVQKFESVPSWMRLIQGIALTQAYLYVSGLGQISTDEINKKMLEAFHSHIEHVLKNFDLFPEECRPRVLKTINSNTLPGLKLQLMKKISPKGEMMTGKQCFEKAKDYKAETVKYCLPYYGKFLTKEKVPILPSGTNVNDLMLFMLDGMYLEFEMQRIATKLTSQELAAKKLLAKPSTSSNSSSSLLSSPADVLNSSFDFDEDREEITSFVSSNTEDCFEEQSPITISNGAATASMIGTAAPKQSGNRGLPSTPRPTPTAVLFIGLFVFVLYADLAQHSEPGYCYRPKSSNSEDLQQPVAQLPGNCTASGKRSRGNIRDAASETARLANNALIVSRNLVRQNRRDEGEDSVSDDEVTHEPPEDPETKRHKQATALLASSADTNRQIGLLVAVAQEEIDLKKQSVALLAKQVANQQHQTDITNAEKLYALTNSDAHRLAYIALLQG
jgi:hypothetical protein